jgi:peptidyl-prolyl cis-trans isomerase C
MADELNLSLPERKSKKLLEQPLMMGLLAACLAIGLLNLVLFMLTQPGAKGQGGVSGLSATQQKELALKLEQQQLHATAVQAWQTYLAGTTLSSDERAKIWYRIGTIHQTAQQYEAALEAYYLSETIKPLTDLAQDLGLRVQECLERLGRFAALRQELSSRVSVNRDKEKAVAETKDIVAEIGTEKISKADLDRLIEEQINLQLSRYAPFLSPEQLQKEKDALFKQYASQEQRVQILNQYVIQEVLYRKAREDKLTDDPTTRALILDTERKILAQSVLTHELAKEIKITTVDVESYYQAHPAEFKQPERAQISHIFLTDKTKAERALTRLQNGESFAALAKSVSEDKETAAKEGAIDGWVNKGAALPVIGSSEEATAAIFSTAGGQTINKLVSSQQGYHIIKVRAREAERQKGLEEAREEVYRKLQQTKEQEVQAKLLEELKKRYNVVIHTSRLPAKAGEKQDGTK